MRPAPKITFRRIAVPLLAAVGLTLTTVSPALAGPSSPPVYLALGDSVPFGFFDTATQFSDFVGYPEYVASARNFKLINASCPGETTDSFGDTSAPSNGCENDAGAPGGYLSSGYPLHVMDDPNYPGESQLDFAIHTLLTTPNVQLVTIMLGADDGFLCREGVPLSYCTNYATIAQHVQSNLTNILRTLRSDGHYTGRIVVVTYYNPVSYANANANTGVLLLNGGIDAAAIANRASIASGYLAFLFPSLRYGGDPVKAGLVQSYTDPHPTTNGQKLLAKAVEVVIPR